jgi:hypothetical protein
MPKENSFETFRRINMADENNALENAENKNARALFELSSRRAAEGLM